MNGLKRAKAVSSFTIIKGAMIAETYAVFAAWDLTCSKSENLDRLRLENFIAAHSQTWLRDVAWVISRRFDPQGRDRPLVALAKSGCDLRTWKPLLLWHITRDEFLFRDYMVNWLFPLFDEGAYRVHPQELASFLVSVPKRGGVIEHTWTNATLRRVAAGLLKMSVDFGLLSGRGVKHFASYHLPEPSFLYLLHAMRDQLGSPQKVIDSPDWRMFLMRPADVERELLRLHQFRKLDYQVAGSLVELTLPCSSSGEYAERLVA